MSSCHGQAGYDATASVSDSCFAISTNAGSHMRAMLSPISNTRGPVPCTTMHPSIGFPMQSGTDGMSFCAVCQLRSSKFAEGILATATETFAMFAVALGARSICGMKTKPATRLKASDVAITGPRNRSSDREARIGVSRIRKLSAASSVAPTPEMKNIGSGLT